MTFAADFIIEGEVAFTNEKIEFISLDEDSNGNPIGVGIIPDSYIKNPDFEVVGDVDLSELIEDNGMGGKTFKSGYDNVVVITKKEWTTETGLRYVGNSLVTSFEESGTIGITLSYYSETFNYQGRLFQYKISKPKDVRINSMFYKLLSKNYPLFEKANNTELEDLFFSLSQFFDRMYRDCNRVFDNIDINEMSPTLLEYMAVTLGHTEDYVKKIGSDVSKDSFESYDIYERIRNGIATQAEVKSFRRFLLFSAELFNKKGTPNDIITLLNFYNMNAKIEELWTENWGTKTFGVTSDTFVGLDKFTDNNLGLRWTDLRVIGNNNDKGHFIHGFNDFTIDSYHEVQKIEFPTDVQSEDNNYYLFNINHGPEYVLDIRRENGETLVDNNVDNDVQNYDIIKQGKQYVLKVKMSVLDYGDRLSVAYKTSVVDPLDSLVSQTETEAYNIDAFVTFKLKGISDQAKNENFRLPEDEIFFVARGVKSEETDIYANFNEYYKIGFNTRRKTFTVSRVFENEKNKSIVIQNLNLSGDKNNLVWESLILDDDGEIYDFKNDVPYQIKVVLNGNYLSLYFREADIYKEIENNISSDVGGTPFGNANQDWFCLIEQLNLNVDQVSVLSLDQNGDEVISVEYVPITKKGMFGVGAHTSIVEVDEISIDNLDYDETLYNTLEKELYVKPKYLDWQSDDLILYNSYDNSSSFTEVIDIDFNPLNRNYEITDQLASSLQFLYFDNAKVTEELASRYTVIFDPDYVSENFSSADDVLEKIIIPVGDQPNLNLIEQRVQSRSFYKDALGGDNEDIPGFTNVNYTPVLGEYETIPFDSFSHLTRTERGFGPDLYLSNRVKEYKNGTESLLIKGIWEEISPLSTTWTEFDGTINLIDGTTYTNKILFPIVVDHPDYNRFLGVRFKNCSDIQKIINRGTFETQTEVPIYGSFIFEMPEESIKFRANQEYIFEESNTPGHIQFRAFLCLGVLNTNIQNYSLGVEFMHHVNNSGATNITLDGVYFRYPSTNFIFHESENRIELESYNPFERKDKGLKVRQYLDAQLNLASKLEDYEHPQQDDVIPNKYLMQSSFRKMLKSLEKESGYDPEMFLDEDGNKIPEQNILDIVYDSWNWWKPERVFRKRDFVELKNNNDNSVTTGINFNPSVNQIKSFFGEDFTASNYPNGVPSQKFKLTDGPVNTHTTYYAKITVRQHWSGYNALGLSAGELDQQYVHSRPLDPQERERLRVAGGARDPIAQDHVQAPTNQCNEYLIPISWYESNDSDTIDWGNYIVGCHGDDQSPTITLTPFGLMTWMFQHATGKINSQDFINNVGQVTSGWTVRDWNERFWDVVRVEFITEEIPADKFELLEEFGFVTKYAPRTGAFIEVDHNIGSVPWYVPGKSLLVPSGIGGYYFKIPRDIKPLRNWNEEIRSISLYNYVVPSGLYSFSSPTTISLSNDQVFDSFEGASFNARTFFDLFFEDNNFETIIDNFEDRREINYTVYENTEGEKYELATRKPSATVAFGLQNVDGETEEPFYDIINVEGKKSFKRIDKSTITVFDPHRLGSNNATNKNVIEDKNGGFKKTIYFLDNSNEVYDLSTEVYFDNSLNDFKNYNGKRFELIIKADNNFNGNTQKYNLEEYYFVGIGTFGFDIALGVARYDFFNDKIEKTFLAGFGDFNTRNIKTGTWYDLKVSVDDKHIKVFFTEAGQKQRLVINYNIDPSRKDDIDRYLKGEFEELVYLVLGLEKNDITYPNKLLDKTNHIFYDENWNQDYAKNIRPAGPLAGFRVFNDLTYIGDVTYNAKIQDDRSFGQVYDVTDISNVIDTIRSQFNPPGKVLFTGKTLNSTMVVLIGTNLFYRLVGKDVTMYSDDVDQVFTYKDKIIIRFICNKSNIVILDDNFMFTRNLFVKDNSLNTDHIFRYKDYTNRKIDRVWVADNNLHVEFQPLGQECNPWGFSVWGDPVWGCFNACLFDD